MFNEHVIDYIDVILLGNLKPELDEHVQAWRERQEATQIWDPVNQEWWQL